MGSLPRKRTRHALTTAATLVRGGGFGHPDHRADFEYWCKMPSLSIPEATCLSVGINPGEFDEREFKRLLSESDRSRFWPAVQYLLKRYDLLFRKFYSRVGSDRLIIWAEQVDLEIPAEFRQKLLAFHAPPSLRSQEDTKASKPDKREIDKIAQLFTAMAIDLYGYVPRDTRSTVPTDIADLAAGMGLQVSTDTIRKYLRIGASFIPDDWQRE